MLYRNKNKMLGFEPIKLPLCFVCLRSVSCARQCLCSSLNAPSVYLCVLFVLCLCVCVSVHPWLPLRFTFIFCLCSFCVLCPVLPVSLFCVLCPALPVSLFCVLCQVLPVSLVSLDCPFGFFSDLFIPPLYHARKVSGHVFVC